MGNYIYKINEEIQIIENSRVKMYGISIFYSDSSPDSEPLEEIKAITSKLSFITEILRLVIRFKPSPIHLKDIVSDIITR